MDCEVVAEILSFLPLRAATRFKTVCKAWNQLISDPHFHRLRTRRSPSSSGRQVVGFFHRSTLNVGCDLLFHTPLPCAAARRGRTAMWSLGGRHAHLSVLAVCDGLLFVAADGRGGELERPYYVWNPSNRSFARVPPAPMESGYFGLAKAGSCSPDSSYVVVNLSYWIDTCSVYSRGTGAWAQLDMQQQLLRPDMYTSNSNYYISMPAPQLNRVGAACARGSLHWLTDSGGILALDIGRGGGRLREMGPPPRWVVVKTGLSGSNIMLGSADDDLYFLLADSAGGAVQLWVLEDYEEVRWKRVMELTCCSNARSAGAGAGCGELLPVYFDGKWVGILKGERTVSFYDARSGKWEGDYRFEAYLDRFRCLFPSIKDVTVLEEEGGAKMSPCSRRKAEREPSFGPYQRPIQFLDSRF